MSDGKDAQPEGDETLEDDASGARSDAEETEEETFVEEAPKGLKDKLRAHLKWIILGVVVLVLGGGGAGVYFSGVLHPEKLHETTLALPGPPVIYELKRITVDLKPTDRRARPFIRLGMQIELQGESAKAAFIANEVKIMDAFQAHLRTITPDELNGEQGTERLREDFAVIVRRIIAPERLIAVFYKDILVR